MSNNAHSGSASHGHISLEVQRKRAKALLARLRDGSAPDQLAILARKSPHSAPSPRLSDAQWLIAQELGFASWPKLKAHVDAIDFAAAHPTFSADGEQHVQHWRCGNDIAHSLSIAGFRGAFHMLADPFCMGPVPDVDTETFLDLRSQFISQAFEIPIDAARERIHSEHQRLSSMADASSVVLWCEADPYDQLFLIYVLANAEPRPRQFEIIEIDRMPGVRRFVGIGQLAPSVLAWLWTKRRVLNDRAITLARKAWDAYRAPGPQAWVEIAHQDNDLLPFLAPAMRRQLQELPSSRDGLSLTERLTLQAVRDGQAMTLGKAFGVLTMHSEPLPSLGDLMFYALIRPLIEGANPLLRVWDSGANWERRPVELTELGYSVLNGEAYWLDYADQTRWVGGMCVMPGKPHWALDDSLVPVWRE